MKLNELQKLLDKISECDHYAAKFASNTGLSPCMRNCLVDAIRERHRCLIRQLSDAGLKIDEEA